MYGNELTENGDDSSQLRRQGSIRKVLPSVPNVDTQLSMSAKMIDRRTNNSKQSYAPFFLEYSLMAEFNILSKQKISGVYVIPAAKTPLKWYGVIFVRYGYYEEGIFRFTLHIPENYPNEVVPRLFFQPPVFHPLINFETGELDLSREFSKWRRNINYLWQILVFMRRIFYNIDATSPVNVNAATLFQDDIEMFKFKVGESMRKSKEFLFDPSTIEDPYEIRFSPMENHQHEELRKKMISMKKMEANNAKSCEETMGYSWVDPETCQTFSESRLTSS